MWLLVFTLVALSCNNDDDGTLVVQAEDLEVTLDENPSQGASLGTIETSGNGTPSFELVSQTPSGALSLDEVTGEVTVADAAAFDFETNPEISATVNVVGAAESVTVSIALNNVPEITLQDLTVDIDENPADGDAIGTVQATGNGDTVFSIATQSPAGALQIDENTGALTVADAGLFDFETHPVITATVAVVDGINTAAVTVSLNNVSELSAQDFSVTIDENPTNGQLLGTIQASGSGNNTFSISTQSPANALSIDTTTGELTVADLNLFDYETNPVITATILVESGVDTATITATINLNDVSELSAQDFSATIDENPTNGQVLGTVQASGSGNTTFSISTQSPAGAITIDAATGELTVADANLFDFETNPVITATISVESGVDTANITATITLNDVSELNAQDFSTTIDENPTDGQVLGTIQATSNGTLTFSINSQTPAGALGINAGTGELSVIDPNLFDYETNPIITAEILIENGTETTTATATITLNDVDEVSAQNTNLNIAENPSNGDVVGSLQASGSNLTYTITFQNPAGAFSIDANTGELSVADETLFDFETNPNMLATISVSNGTQTVSANAMVALDDLNEIGEYKFGGVIFWIDPASNNSEGLVCATTNLNVANWGCSGTLTGASGTGIGTGETNTATLIAAGCGLTAAESVSNLDWNGYDDWFLPSIDEFNEIAVNYNAYIWPTIQANGGSALMGTVWTSTEVNANDAYIAFLGGNAPVALTKSVANIHVLPVRSFTDF
ncbi:hypothetical protein B7P33_01775 [Sediminicola luteus]|uniref:Cadherin domain-containing protein n=1 Tax=Sediminicola luteus TaxID=319238 RepID=A0A2A4GE30_9FLAO|nr:hypothetical protein B7P33_01775 [Sediminicola luteus]